VNRCCMWTRSRRAALCHSLMSHVFCERKSCMCGSRHSREVGGASAKRGIFQVLVGFFLFWWLGLMPDNRCEVEWLFS
jgi:hypothetical protein